MLRKLLLLILFLAFSALVIGLLSADRAGIEFWGAAGQASPSTKPLPQAWSGAGRATVRLPGQPATPAAAGATPATAGATPATAGATPATAGAASSACPVTVTVQSGDTLGAIAKRCGISLTELLAANPAISNPNRIDTGQQILIHGERGGGSLEAVTAQPVASGFAPGAQVIVEAAGFAAGAQVKIGIGLPGAGFRSLGVYDAGPDGRLSAELTIPSAARRGERAFFLLASSGSPTTTVISEGFVIGE